jgi:hypothetical protein
MEQLKMRLWDVGIGNTFLGVAKYHARLAENRYTHAKDVKKVVSTLSACHMVATISQADRCLAPGPVLEVYASNNAFRDHVLESLIVKVFHTLVLDAAIFISGAEIDIPKEYRLEVVDVQLSSAIACLGTVVVLQRLGEDSLDAFAAEQAVVFVGVSGFVRSLFSPVEGPGVVVLLCTATTFPDTGAFGFERLEKLLLWSG